jgi:hypothetical protein
VSWLLYTICSALPENISASQGEFWVQSGRTLRFRRGGKRERSGCWKVSAAHPGSAFAFGQTTEASPPFPSRFVLVSRLFPRDGNHPELLHQAQAILNAPLFDYVPVCITEEHHPGHGDRFARWGNATERPPVGPGKDIADNDHVAFSHRVFNGKMGIGKSRRIGHVQLSGSCKTVQRPIRRVNEHPGAYSTSMRAGVC